MAGQANLNGDLRRLQIKDFPDHHNVGVMAQHRPQARGKSQSDSRIYLNLCHAFELIFDRVFNRDDFICSRVDLMQTRIKCCGFPASGGAGDKNNPVRFTDNFLQIVPVFQRQSQISQII